MKSSSQAPVWRVLVISFVLFASLIFVSRAAAQDIGTVKNEDGSTTTTVQDRTYGTSGVKSTTTDSKGRVSLEQWRGNTRSDGTRPLFKQIDTFYEKGRVKLVNTTNFNVKGQSIPRPVTEEAVRTDALGGVIYKETTKYDNDYQITEGTRTTVDLESGKKTIENYNPKTHEFEEAEPPAKEDSKKEPEKKEEPKKETPKEDFPERQTIEAGFFSPGKYQGYREFVYSACQESNYRHKGTTRDDLYLTVAPDSVVMLLGYFEGNTGASNYFESKNGTMNLDGSHMIGGIQNKTGHYFDVSFTYNSVTKGYVGKGTWNSLDYFCNDSYPVTIVLAPVADFHD